MSFSSILFLFFFLPGALFLYFVSPAFLRLTVLTVCSYFFYAWSDPRFVLLLIWTTVVDYSLGNIIGGVWWRGGKTPQRIRKLLLGLSLSNSICLLIWFKYAAMGQEILIALLHPFGVKGWTIQQVVLPVGISFYTFESISYVVDIYRCVCTPAGIGKGGLQRFACYLAQFPHLVAGPIIRYQELAPQFNHPRTSVNRFARGIALLSIGLSKKVLLADTLAPAVDAVFSAGTIPFHQAWFGVIAFAFQIYFDFSGYTDMACGMAMMLGFRFPENFASPYRAVSITDFWRRWHITLSRWLRDYIYIPLGGNRRGVGRTYVNLMLTMLIGGIWHGAAMTFVLWGAFHGVCLAIERALRLSPPRPGWQTLLRTFVTFLLVCLGWSIFRASETFVALNLMIEMLLPGFFDNPYSLATTLFTQQIILAMICSASVCFFGIQSSRLTRQLSGWRTVLFLALFVASIVVLTVRLSIPFIYFQF